MIIYPLRKAQELTDKLNAFEEKVESPTGEDWAYKVEDLGNGKAKVAAYDEEGEFVAYL